MANTALDKAIEVAGSQSALARAIHTSQANVWYWLNKAKAIPAEFAEPIEAATGGQVSRHDLRPDLFGPKPVDTPSQETQQ